MVSMGTNGSLVEDADKCWILSRRIGQKSEYTNPDGWICWCWIDSIGSVTIDCTDYTGASNKHRIYHDSDPITAVYKANEVPRQRR